MWPFNRKSEDANTEAVPEEIRDYYQAEKRDRMWTTWLMSGATFVATVLVVIGLFWGGRWAYRQITADQEQSQPDVAITEGSDSESGQAPEATPEAPAPDSQPTPDTDQPSHQPSDQPANQPAPVPTPQPQTTPQTGSTPELPQTGPSSDE